jgi:hypothetical protein
MSKVLDRMKATLEEKRKKLLVLQNEVRSFENVIAYYEAHPEELEVRVATPDEVKNAVEQLLDNQNEKKPLHYKNNLFPMLVRAGIEIAGQDQPRNLGAYLSGDKRFLSYGDGMWGLRRWKEGGLSQPQSNNNGHNSRPSDIKIG